jgi:hypothetical protein
VSGTLKRVLLAAFSNPLTSASKRSSTFAFVRKRPFDFLTHLAPGLFGVSRGRAAIRSRKSVQPVSLSAVSQTKWVLVWLKAER